MNEIKMKQTGDNSVQIGHMSGGVVNIYNSHNEQSSNIQSPISPDEIIGDSIDSVVDFSKLPLDKYYNMIIDVLLKNQRGNGEFGKYRNINVVSSSRAYDDEGIEPDQKPNAFVTMYCVLLMYGLPQYRLNMDMALNWLYSAIEDGFFITEVARTDPLDSMVSERNTYMERVRVYRHSGEALTALLTLEQINITVLSMLQNILSVQNDDGGWGNTASNPQSKLFSTAFILQALTHENISLLFNLLSRVEKEKTIKRLEKAKSNATLWLINQNEAGKGFWYLPDVGEKNKYLYSGVILDALAPLFAKETPQFTKAFVARILSDRKDDVWGTKNTVDFAATATLLSALYKLRKHGLDINISDFDKTRLQLQQHYGKFAFADSGALCYLANAVHEEICEIKLAEGGSRDEGN